MVRKAGLKTKAQTEADNHGPSNRSRSRNAKATREAILLAARAAFAQDSYDRMGVREIAAAAGVDPALVNRYFVSKELLFIESVSAQQSLENLLFGDRANWGVHLARMVLQHGPDEGGINNLLILLRSSSNSKAGMLLRRSMDTAIVEPLAVKLGGENALIRAGLIITYLTGLMVMRTMIGSESLTSADAETVVSLVAPVLQSYIDR